LSPRTIPPLCNFARTSMAWSRGRQRAAA